MAKTIVALYDDVNHAQMAVRDLVDSGVDRDHISLMATNPTTGEMSSTTGDFGTTPAVGDTSGAAEGAGVGAGIGAALGGIGGLLVGLGALAIPGIGPVLAAGPLAAALGGVAGAGAGAIAGGATGGLIGALTDMGVGEEQAGYYAEGIRRGGTLLTIRTDDQIASRAVDVMNKHHPVDVKERVSQWRETGWKTFDVNASPYTSAAGTTTRDYDRDFSRTGDLGTTGRSDPGLTSFGMAGPNLDTEMSGSLDDRSSIRGEQSRATDLERSTIEEPEDQINYATNIGAASNIGSIGTSDELDDQINYGTNMGAGSNMGSTGTTGTGYSSGTGTGTGYTGSRTFDTYENGFRSHFDTTYANRGSTYNQYMPAYRYGYDLNANERYRGRDWNEFEPEARQDWESRYPDNAWEDFKDAVRHSWQQVKDVFD